MIKEKLCSKCGIIKPVSEFHKDRTNPTGYYSCCKKCKLEYMKKRWNTDDEYRAKKKSEDKLRKEYFISYSKKRRDDPIQREKHRLYMIEYWNKKENKERASALRKSEEGREKSRIASKRYRENNPEKVKEALKIYNKNRRGMQWYKEYRNKYEKDRRENDPAYRAMISCRNRIYKTVKNKNKTSKFLIGCESELFIKHIENKFTNKMSWDNYGEYWHIDHIIPCNYFDLTNIEEQKICFNYRNTQPLEKSYNCSKQDDLPKNGDKLYNEIKKALAETSA